MWSPAETKGKRVGLVVGTGGQRPGDQWRKPMEEEGCSEQFRSYRCIRALTAVSSGEDVLLFLVQRGHTCPGKSYALLLNREREVRDFVNLLFLQCLPLKIINVPKWQPWGWNVLVPSLPDAVLSHLSTCSFSIQCQHSELYNSYFF